MPQFELVEGDGPGAAPAPRAAPAAPKPTAASINALALLLGALSQRAVIALADLFTLLTVGSAFWVWCSVLDPNVYQIVSHSIYGVFVLAANWIVRRKA